MVAYNIISKLKGKQLEFPKETMLGALSDFISTPNKDFQPMNANFGIVPPLETKIKDKKVKYEKYAKRALEALEEYINEFENIR